ncbi:gluconokinase [Allomesorhizobium alhagi]|jgi:gluconokinase|uniref:Gluconokinase n=1 Tax=Mesorhizobium alhagi CCNWXJ12-2 TaxID=1107882 RepID=H0HTV4_9HYPH|nr:gluconokinase [Mesorhizobium alhagi]EHK55841.1 thermoresistant glucokinase family carbohydrate kinase [Mesorhizobium alhagi CCNWXJ12-2]
MEMKPEPDQAGSAGLVPVVVVMGVAGCGKSVVGSGLAEALGCRFIEGDGLHPPENVARMAGGQPLTDAHRAGWLDAVGAQLSEAARAGSGGVAACSALKRAYRDRLRRICPGLVFIHLAIDRETARQRVGRRKGHFMPATLVDSQFATLEPPAGDEAALNLDGTRPVAELVAAAAEFLIRAKTA